MRFSEILKKGYIETDEGIIKIEGRCRRTDEDVITCDGLLEIEQQFYDYLDEGVAGVYAGLVPYVETFHIPVEIYFKMKDEISDEVDNIDWEEVKKNVK